MNRNPHGECAQVVAETMVAMLGGSPGVEAIETQCDSVGKIEPPDDEGGLTPPRIRP